MCGRYTLRTPAERLKGEFRLRELPPVEARYNISPAQNVLAVRQAAGGREAVLLKWGLIPSWAEDDSMSARLINARGETVAEKPAFRNAFRRRRCVIPADGAYEWKRGGGGRRQPFYFRMRDGRPFGFAGLWDRWEGRDGDAVESCAIITTEANEIFLEAHERMPVILPPEAYDVWLDEGVRDMELLKGLLRPYNASEMVAYPVSSRVNNPQSQGEDLVERLTASSV
jgi:putative SOS response-associated peptidase YedK